MVVFPRQLTCSGSAVEAAELLLATSSVSRRSLVRLLSDHGQRIENKSDTVTLPQENAD